jgi:thiol-disulfide isomerase/thioredoxin
MTALPSPAAEPPLLVACLCAQWCGTCGAYRAAFDALAAEIGAQAQFVWVDIEDQADALGDVDVEDFPTLLVARGDTLLFFGPLTPQPSTLARLLRSALDGDLAERHDARWAGLPGRVRALKER